MKKFLGILVLGLLWCNVGFANILLNKCAMFYPAGTDHLMRGILEKELVIELGKDSRSEYFVSYEDGFVYHTFVRSGSLTDIFNELYPEPTQRTTNLKFVITFADDKLITAKGRSKHNPANPEIYTTMELEINLENGEIFVRHGAETIEGMQLLELMRKYDGDNIDRYRCEFAETKQDAQGSSGTAFFIDTKGHLLTNNHVVEGCKSQKINYFNKEYEAKIITTDKTLDLALLKADVRPRSFISFSNKEPRKRQLVIVAGYPLGKYLSDDLKINVGNISSLKGFDNNSNEITVDLAINPGNSGGPIVNGNGQLVAVAVAGMSKEVTEGISFGIKSSAVTNFLKTNKISPDFKLTSFSMNDEKVNQLLEESTVYIFCEQ